MSLFIAHTGWWWLNVVVYVVSGGAFLAICYLAPRYYEETLKPVYDEMLATIREIERQRKDD